MSDHDPFDGIYDSGKPAATSTVPAQPAAPVSEVEHHETFTHGQLDEMRKAELQALARERGLDTSGTRDELIARIDEAQRAESHGS